jgi:hypothetical protein
MLSITTSDNGPEWKLCKTNLPYKVQCHTLTTFKGKMIFIGGLVGGSVSNKVWKGTFKSKKEITWAPMPSMKRARLGHFCIVVDDKIYVIGGEYSGNASVEVFDGIKWKEGPSFSISLNTHNANAVLDRKKRIVLTTNEHGIVTYHPIKKSIEQAPTFKLKEERQWYSALLQ